MTKPTDRRKFQYLPEAENDFIFMIIGGSDGPTYPVDAAEPPPAPEPEPEPQEPAGIYPCPCCGYLTLPVPREEALAYICPVCFWENDVFDPGEDDPSDENQGMTLRQGRENYRRWGQSAGIWRGTPGSLGPVSSRPRRPPNDAIRIGI